MPRPKNPSSAMFLIARQAGWRYGPLQSAEGEQAVRDFFPEKLGTHRGLPFISAQPGLERTRKRQASRPARDGRTARDERAAATRWRPTATRPAEHDRSMARKESRWSTPRGSKASGAAALEDDVARGARSRPGFGNRDRGSKVRGASWRTSNPDPGSRMTGRERYLVDDGPIDLAGAQAIGASEPRTVPCRVNENLRLESANPEPRIAAAM